MTVSEKKTKRWGILRIILFVGVGAAVVFAGWEGLTRFREWRGGIPFWANERPGALMSDDRLGWATRPSYKSTYTQWTLAGASYPVRFSQDASGLRTCSGGEGGKKIVVVGDSDTEAVQANDDQEYYCVAARDLGAKVFAYGAGGYGSLQEKMVLDRLVPSLQPDVVIVQIGSNDFINNDYELEQRSYTNNHNALRPYWRSGHLVYLFPSHFPMWFEVLRAHSRIFSHWYDERLQREIRTSRGVEDDIAQQGANYPGFATATEETKQIFAQIKALTTGRTLIALATDLKEPYQTAYRQMFQDLNIPLIEDAGKAVNEAQARGVDVYVTDNRHWTETGHKIYGDALAQGILARPELHFR